MNARESVVADSLEEAVSCVQDGMVVGLGGFTASGRPIALVRALVRRRPRNLTVVGGASASLDLDLLIATGCVSKVISPYTGAEAYAPIAPFFQAAAINGSLTVWECDEGILYAGLRAAAAQLPFLPWRSGVGTSLPELNPDLRIFADPISGQQLIAVPAIPIDVALIHATRSDPYGNVQHLNPLGDVSIWRAARRTVVQVDQLVTVEEVRREPRLTSLVGVDVVVQARRAAHPFASFGRYREDAQELGDWAAAARAAARGREPAAWHDWLASRVMVGHEAYLRRFRLSPEAPE